MSLIFINTDKNYANTSERSQILPAVKIIFSTITVERIINCKYGRLKTNKYSLICHKIKEQ
jgi:hypothetical protein